MEFEDGKGRRAIQPMTCSPVDCCDGGDALGFVNGADETGVESVEVVQARYTAPPFSIAYLPGSSASSCSKFWKSRLIGRDCAYARNNLLTPSLSSGKKAGRIFTSGLVTWLILSFVYASGV